MDDPLIEVLLQKKAYGWGFIKIGQSSQDPIGEDPLFKT
jgi:hypothetical protein